MPTFQRPTRLPLSKIPLRIVSYRSPDHKAAPLRTITPAVKRRVTRVRPVQAKTNGFTHRAQPIAQVGPDSLSLTLPVPPSINHQYATVHGRRLLSSEGRAYKAQVAQAVWLGLTQSTYRTTLLSRLKSESLALSIHFYFISSLRRDLDGGLKIAQDAICAGLDLNDNRIMETHLYKHVDKDRPRIEVALSVMPLSKCSPSPR